MAMTTCLIILCVVGVAGEKTPSKVKMETVITDVQQLVRARPPTGSRFVNSKPSRFNVIMGHSKNNHGKNFTNVSVAYNEGYNGTYNNVSHDDTAFLQRRVPRDIPFLLLSILPPFKDENGTLASIQTWSEIVCGSKSMCKSNTECAYADCPKCSCADDCSTYGDCCPELLATNGLQMEGIHCVSSSFIKSVGSEEQW